MNIKATIKNIISNPTSFLLHNSGVKQTIAKNTFWLAVAEGITRFLKFFLIIYIARILGATEYGKFTFALAFVSLFVVFSDFGISTITTREISREREKEKEFPVILSLKFILSILTLFLIYISSFFITFDIETRKIIWVLGIYIIISSFSGIIYSFFRARQKMEYEAWAKIIQAFIVTGIGFFVLFNFPSIKNLSFAYLFAVLTTLFFLLFFFHFKVYSLKIEFNKIIWKRILTMSWPLALAGIFGVIYSQIDSVMMGYWGQITQNGWYNAAYKITGITLIPVVLIYTSFYPVFSKAFKESRKNLQKIWDYYVQLMIFLAVPLVIGGTVLASKIIDFIYDPSYIPSILAFQILIVTSGFLILSNPFNQFLIISDNQKKFFWITLIGAIINIILNFFLIPKYSLYGAAFTTLITSLLIFFLLFEIISRIALIKILSYKLFLTFISSLISCVPMFFIITLPKVYNFNVLISIFVGTLVYSTTFFLIRKLINFNL